MPDEPIRVSSTAWTGLPDEARLPPEPKPKPKPFSLAEGIALSAAGMALFGSAIMHALSTGAIRTRHSGTVTATADPGEFNGHGMMYLALFLLSCVAFVICLRTAWRRRRDRVLRPLFQPGTELERPEETGA